MAAMAGIVCVLSLSNAERLSKYGCGYAHWASATARATAATNCGCWCCDWSVVVCAGVSSDSTRGRKMGGHRTLGSRSAPYWTLVVGLSLASVAIGQSIKTPLTPSLVQDMVEGVGAMLAAHRAAPIPAMDLLNAARLLNAAKSVPGVSVQVPPKACKVTAQTLAVCPVQDRQIVTAARSLFGCQLLPNTAKRVHATFNDMIPRPIDAFAAVTAADDARMPRAGMAPLFENILRMRIGGSMDGISGTTLFAESAEPSDRRTVAATGWAMHGLAALTELLGPSAAPEGVRQALRATSKLLRAAPPAGKGRKALGQVGEDPVVATSLALGGAFRLAAALRREGTRNTITSRIDDMNAEAAAERQISDPAQPADTAGLCAFLIASAKRAARHTREGGQALAHAAHALDALVTLVASTERAPAAVRLVSSRIASHRRSRLGVRVASLLGSPLAAAVTVVGLARGRSLAAPAARTEARLTARPGTAGVLDLSLAAIDGIDGPGYYAVDLDVSPAPGAAFAPAAATRRLITVSAVAVALSASVTVVGESGIPATRTRDLRAAGSGRAAGAGVGEASARRSHGDAGALREVTVQGDASDGGGLPTHTSAGDNVTLSAALAFEGASPAAEFRPAQVTFLLVQLAGGGAVRGGWSTTKQAVLHASRDAEAGLGVWSARLRLPRPHLNETATDPLSGLVPGEYSVTLLVGDELLDAALRLSLGTLHLALPELKDDTHTQDPIIYSRHLLFDSDRATSPLPEIVHRFRPADGRAPLWASCAVSGLVVAIALCTAWRALFAAAKAPPRSGISGVLLGTFLMALLGVAAALGAYFVEAYDVFGLVLVVSGLCAVLGVVGRALMQPLA